jgi:hypothetical protein
MAKTKDDILQHLPRYYIGNLLFAAIFDAVAPELTLAETRVDEVAKQGFVTTATAEGLLRWEDELGIPTDLTLSIPIRRRRCIAHIMGLDVTNKTKLKAIVDTFIDGENCVIVEDFAAYQVTVQMVETHGFIENEDDLRLMIESILPAHLELLFDYEFNLWSEVLSLGDWDDARAWGDWIDILGTEI